MNYYEILKLSKNATDHEIKLAYKDLVKKYHPDLYVGDKEFAEHKIKQINEAYDVLSDSEKKAEYDEYLNPKIEPEIESPSYYKTKNTSSETSNSKTQTTNTSPVSNFLFSKFNNLNKKQQLAIFLIAFFIVLSLFFINLLQFKDIFNEKLNENMSYEEQNEITSIPSNNDNSYDNFTDIDNMIYDLFKSYEENLYNETH